MPLNLIINLRSIMGKVYLVNRSYMRVDNSGDYRWEEIYYEDGVAYSTREGAQARCDELNRKEYGYAKAHWERADRERWEKYRMEADRYTALSAAGISYPKPIEPVKAGFYSMEEWLDCDFDTDRYDVVEWELQ